jgi:hypothetical protein
MTSRRRIAKWYVVDKRVTKQDINKGGTGALQQPSLIFFCDGEAKKLGQFITKKFRVIVRNAKKDAKNDVKIKVKNKISRTLRRKLAKYDLGNVTFVNIPRVFYLIKIVYWWTIISAI